MKNPEEVVTAYFAAVTDGDPARVAGLFAADAVLVNAAGTLNGSDAISRMYHNGMAKNTMQPAPGQLLVADERVAVEIDLTTNGQTVKLCDIFTVRNGEIISLVIYSLAPAGGRLFDDVGIDPAAK